MSRPKELQLTNSHEEETAAALQTVVAGQQAENLLDFDADEPATPGNENTFAGMGSTSGITSQAIASAAKSTNPLDELMDLFSTANVATPAPAVPAAPAAASMDFSGLSSPSGGTPPPAPAPAAAAPAQQSGASDDLLGLF